MPEVRDWDSVSVALERGGCFGRCAAYDIEIRGDGQVRYRGRGYVPVLGEHLGRIAREDVQRLLQEFRDGGFYALAPKYAGLITDGVYRVITVWIDGQSRSVYQASAEAPPVFAQLWQAVERLAQADMWVKGNARTVEALRREGFDFRSQAAGRMLAWVAGLGDRNVVRELIAAGAPLNVPTEEPLRLPGVPLVRGVSNSDPEVLRLLVEAGASKDDAVAKRGALDAAMGRGDPWWMLLENY